jgi:uncharacterized RDD family membrane protein YckC
MSVLVHTSQHVTLEYQPASVGDRMLATLVDYGVFLGWGMILGLISTAFRNASYTSSLLVGLFFMGPIVFYDLVCEYLLNGQSVGKIALNIRVVMLDGSQPDLGAYLLRWVLRIVESGAILFGIVPIIVVAVSGKGQRLGDIAAGTTVVKLKPAVSLTDVLTQPVEENYQILFPDVRLLTDHDVSVVRDVLRRGDAWAVDQTAERIKEVTGITSSLGSRAFLHQIITDYQFITSQ